MGGVIGDLYKVNLLRDFEIDLIRSHINYLVKIYPDKN